MKNIFSITINIRPASPEDLKKDSKNLRVGQVYWLKSNIEEVFEGPYFIDENTDPNEIYIWLKNEMIYTPIRERNSFKI